ncbi:CPBP family intramembrane glutamic endopeptidase [Flavobacterium piscis]|uniref:Membrane protease YdiL (CAAX protease family) n=1 Tax=Flavobacterium piscis TaxID=1114874 RepID=A0ABU1Y747_9FLAO|nr:CPBP family intramembrane glutamic endopeptidase [Flavobacterium piscis]MDR7209341.1 membrane protease YdiL (CAAX protease family) [Flavobacterium piscis]
MTNKILNNSNILIFIKKYYLSLLFIFYLFLTVLNGYFFNWVNNTFFNFTNETENGLRDFSYNEKFMLIVIIAPLVETVIFQYLPIRILEKLRLENNWVKIILTSLLFSLFHFYNPIYVAMTFVSGMLLNKFYLESRAKSKFYFVLTALLHSMYNLYGYLFVK